MVSTLLSLTCIVPAVWFAYTIRSWWVTRGDWDRLSPDTKAFYLLVAPPFTLTLDLLMMTDRLFYWPRSGHHPAARRRSARVVRSLVAGIGMVLVADAAFAEDEIAPKETTSLSVSQTTREDGGQRPRQPYLNASQAAAVQYRDLQGPEESLTASPSSEN